MDDETYEHLHGSKPPISLEGLTAWFRSEEAQVPWPSMVGSHQGQVVSQKADFSLGNEMDHPARTVIRDWGGCMEGSCLVFGPFQLECVGPAIK